ncbi:5'-nucleotidase [Rhodobacteraceae bacterium KLH11]|nr:5'-nucleotidase [Rhodobacteraceae bacterium KLH11]
MLSDFLASLRARLLTTSSLAQETVRDGQTLNNGFFQSTVVDNTPAFVLDNDFARLLNFGQIETNNAVAAVSVEGENGQVFNFRSGSIEANSGPDALATGVQVSGSADIRNFGEITGDFNGVQFVGANSSGRLDNFSGGVISSVSRAVDIQGQGISVRNFGDIIGLEDQRNGTIYTNSTAEDISISNFSGGTIDAGAGNSGAGISLQVGDEVGDRVSNTLFNGFGATIQGRGQEASNTGGAGDGIRINNGAEGTIAEVDIVNSGLVSSESNQGTAGGIRIADGANSEGRILNTSTGTIEGVRNGLYIGNAEHDLDILNFGTIQSGSRAVNIDGTGVDLTNGGDILGTGDQRNGTVYADGTADDFSVRNLANGTIDAGEHNQGSGFATEIGGAADGANTFTLENDGLIQGRGNGAAGTGLAGDGIRIGNPGNSGTAEATIINRGEIRSEGANGTVAGARVVDGVSLDGEFINAGTISGVQNGVYFGNADHSGARFVNEEGGVVSSDSRAFNIDGVGLQVENAGDILGTADQRNGTVYADGTADDFSVTNEVTGVIDAGEGNQGSGFGAEIGGAEDGANTFALENNGTIQGRGNAGAATNLAGDGVRIGNVGNVGTTDATIVNNGSITSEGANGTVAGVRVVNGINFKGSLVNNGLVSGVQNGVYFGTGDHTGGSFVNNGTVTSASRAVNIDGEGLDVVNNGAILGTGNQRNGTVYADGTADNYTFTNAGTVDAGLGNNGSGVSLQTGDVDGDVVSAAIFNEGLIQGRGDATEGNQVGDGLRLFSNVENANFAGLVQNDGVIAGSEDSDAAAGIRVDGGLNLLGAILNEGEISGQVNAIDATDAGSVTFVNDDSGVVNGNVLLGAGDDIVVDLGQINGVIDGGAGDDVLIAGEGDNVIVGGLGNDFIDGGEGIDTADFSDLDVAVKVNLGANGNGTATRDTGFNISVVDQVVDAPAQFGSDIEDGGEFVEQAAANNLYYNIHTADFPAGEIRGQLLVDSDVTENGIRTINLSGPLDAAQEPGPLSDSEATGFATAVVVQNLETGEVTYSSELSVTGLNEADLQTPIPGVVSSIHLHNAPAGVNGPVVQDTLVDAGATLDVDAVGGTGVIGADVIENQIETDILTSIENVIGSDDGDVIIGSNQDNKLNGADGNDVLNGEGGDDLLIGGEGNDTFVFEGEFGNDTVQDFQSGFDQLDFGDFEGPLNIVQDGADAVLSFASDNSVRLQGINASDLTDDDFVA